MHGVHHSLCLIQICESYLRARALPHCSTTLFERMYVLICIFSGIRRGSKEEGGGGGVTGQTQLRDFRKGLN